MKSLLERQIRKYLTWLTAEEFKKLEWFLLAVDEAYEYSESDRRLMEHSLDISSKELMWINESLRKSASEKQHVLDTLLTSVNSLEKVKNQNVHFHEISVENIAAYLKKLVEENLISQERLEILSKAINTSNVSVIVWEKKINENVKRIKYVSKNIEKIFGYSHEDFVTGKIQFEDFVLPEDKAHFNHVHQTLEEERKIELLEYRVRAADGKIIWVNEQAIFMLKNNGEIIEHEGIIVDITALKEKQQLIVNNEKYLSNIVDSIWEGICVIDQDRNIQLINFTAISMLGLSLSKWQWRRYDDLLNFYQISTMNRYKDFVKESFEGESKVDIIFDDIAIKTPNNFIPVSVVVSNFNIEGTDKEGCIVVFRDKIKEKEVEDMKNEFISIASHELRTPMTVINGFSEMLLEEKLWTLNENQKRYLSRIQTNTVQLISMVNDMLTLSKLESSKMDIQLWDFDIAEVIGEVVTEVGVIAKQKNITLSIEANSAIVFSDKSKVWQVLVNLLANACKFTPKDGSVKVVQTFTSTECTISIQDTGIGIKESDIPKLFSKFYQAQQHLQSRQQGTGLGLSICKLILSHLQGKIWVKSEVGKGSEFSFSIPLKYVEEKQEIK